MAVDPNDDDKQDEKRDVDTDEADDESEFVPIKRQPKSLLASKSLPSVSNALDDFIISANQKPLDVAEFTPETREQSLRDEIAELKKKLAAAESKTATAAEPEAPTAGGRSWGAIVGAFVVGAGLMFAVGKLTSSSEAPRQYAPPAAMDESAPRPDDKPNVADPIAHEPATPVAPPVAVAPPSEPAMQTPAQPPKQPPTVASKQPPKQPKSPKQPKEPAQDGSASKPPPPQDGSGGDLYNPF
jgi:hypothetical protein